LRTSSFCFGCRVSLFSIFCTFLLHSKHGIYFGFRIQHFQLNVPFILFRASIVLASIFAGVAVSFLIVNCFKPTGTRGLLTEEWAMVA
jgi:hypothetical protein